MCRLNTGTFGSFIGYSSGFPMLIKILFPDVNPIQYAVRLFGSIGRRADTA